MNLCIVSEFNCTFDDFAAMVEKSRDEAEAFICVMSAPSGIAHTQTNSRM